MSTPVIRSSTTAPIDDDLRTVPDLSAWRDGDADTIVTPTARAGAASGWRHRVDPAVCGRERAPAEWEFAEAIRAYQRSSGRLFPTWSEVLEVFQGLGYAKAG
jgi:hypothetical protein